jgi:aspartate racemase
MKKLGVIGGLGPMASAYFLQMIVEMTDAAWDQEHIETILYSNPAIPDRTSYILGVSKESPLAGLVETGKKLEQMGVEVIAIPCITAHYFRKSLEEELQCPVIDGIRETAAYLNFHKIQKVGILATEGTTKSRLFQDTFQKNGIDCVVPESKDQEIVMQTIYRCIKAGQPVNQQMVDDIADRLAQKGAEKILLGCTELSLLKQKNTIGPQYLDVMEIMAGKAVSMCGKLKSEYQYLVPVETEV